MPQGQGLWPAFWMLGANNSSVGWPACGEVDIMEHINSENQVYGTLHWLNTSNTLVSSGGGTATTAADYHVYGIEWTPTAIKWFVDGAKFHEVNIANGAAGTEEFQKPFFLILNLAVGGTWPGPTVDESKLPATMFVDYVRVYQLTASPAPVAFLQAEAYNVMGGVQVENTTDAGGGQNVGWIDATDWLVYNNVTFPTSGAYTIEYRVASPGGSRLSSDFNAGTIQLGSVSVPATGGWQNWTTVSQTVTVNAGTYNFGLYAPAGGWNLNWIRISKASGNRAALASSGGTAANQEALGVHPNPATDHLTLAAPAELRGGQLSVLNLQGEEVWRGTYDGQAVDVSALRPGLYTLVLVTKDRQKLTRRFSKH